MKSVSQELCLKKTLNAWSTLAKRTMSRLIVFNKRGSEVSKLIIDTYKNRPDWTQFNNQELIESLSAVEKKMISRYIIFYMWVNKIFIHEFCNMKSLISLILILIWFNGTSAHMGHFSA